MEKEREDLVTLLDEEGLEHDFIVLDVLPVNAYEYAILLPVKYASDEEKGEVEEEAVIFKIVDEDGEQTLVTVEDEGEWKQVASAWEERMQQLDYELEEEQEQIEGGNNE